MFNKIKNRVDKELLDFISYLDKKYRLKALSPLLFESIQDFFLRDGKRLRPILFILGYLGYAPRPKKGLYTSALAIELLHDFMLVHDDIIDKSRLRRGKPSLHVKLNAFLRNKKNVKFNGQDLAIVTGDVMYAMAIDAFLSIKENMQRKEKALKKFIEAAIFTGTGEFIELLIGAKHIKDITQQEIYKVYDYKTAHYTFATPLATGAILAGASVKEIQLLTAYGMYLGRAFQIKDDIIGMFSDEQKIGKSILTDLQESKRTLLIWKAYHKGSTKDKKTIEKALTKKNVTMADLSKVKLIMERTKALQESKKEILTLTKKAQKQISSTKIKKSFKQLLLDYPQQLLKL